MDDKTKEKMMVLLGNLEAITYPIVTSEDEGFNRAYYDLIDDIHLQYIGILKDLWGYEDEGHH